MDYFSLIRHSYPEKDTTMPANQWRLSHQGRKAAKNLAGQLKDFGLTMMISSIEAKAIETSQIVANELGIPFSIANGFHEQDRSNIGFLASKDQFESKIKKLMEKPDECVFGLESANQAYNRFHHALGGLINDFEGEKIALVTHGTVMSLFIAKTNNLDPFEFWKSLDMPTLVKISLPDYQI